MSQKDESDYRKDVENWYATSVFFQNAMDRNKQLYEDKKIKRKEYYTNKRAIQADWDVSMKQTNPILKRYPVLDFDKEVQH